MYYKLDESIGLRGWDGTPYALRHFPSGATEFLSEAQFQALSFCDGNFDCGSLLLLPAHKKFIELVEKRGIITPCEKGTELDERQTYKVFPCKFIGLVHWSITGKCNMRCRHCFLSAPQAKYGEISTAAALGIVKQLAEAGIARVSLTGGEPLVRGDFWEIVDALRVEDIVIEQIYTNGMLVNETLLDGLEKRGVKPSFSLSFDGVGWHDWLRGIDGAQEIAVNAIKLLRSREYSVSVESAFHRGSIGSIGDTMRLLAELGVRSWKTNPASGSGNWLNESRDLDLDAGEMYEAYLSLIGEYFAAGSPINIQMGGFFACTKGSRKYRLPAKKPYKNAEKRLQEPLCMSARNTMYLSADAKVLPCIPLSGLPIQNEFPSLFDMTVAEAMRDSIYLERIESPISELFTHQKECAVCEHRLRCGGGCRAAALTENNGTDYFGIDSWFCLFFKGGYEEKIAAVAAME
jgi:radical SAM protein with 4Fe4S-binding SPASM domain